MKLLFALSLIVLIGCIQPASHINKVSLGMPKERVIKILGEPDSITADETGTNLNYSLGEGRDRSYGTPYTIRIVNGSVVSYGRAIEGGSSRRSVPVVMPPMIIH